MLHQKLRRTYFVARLWLASIQPNPPDCNSEESRWILEDGSYIMLWYEDKSAPSMLDVSFQDAHENDSTTNSFGNKG